ncbi:MAG: hypothetical protein JST73_06400 [Actinobacteria bacterium]|nr:hypothetical protein [Actinomycetota bacterium]
MTIAATPVPVEAIHRVAVPIRWIAISAVFVNLGIHLAMAPDHLAEKFYIGVLFLVGSVFLALVAVGLSTDRDRPRTLAWLVGGVVCAVEIALFVISRTTGLPEGYKEGWLGSTENYLGLVSLSVEALFIGCAVVSLTRIANQTGRSTFGFRDRTAPLP